MSSLSYPKINIFWGPKLFLSYENLTSEYAITVWRPPSVIFSNTQFVSDPQLLLFAVKQKSFFLSTWQTLVNIQFASDPQVVEATGA